jgi:hypothetical protein
MDRTLTDYFAAWNEPDSEKRAGLLEASITERAELVDPTGRWSGVDGLSERIANYHASAPGTKVVPGSGVDSHNGIERYGWLIVDQDGNEIMEGIDVAERLDDGRLSRILMFHGPLPPLD